MPIYSVRRLGFENGLPKPCIVGISWEATP